MDPYLASRVAAGEVIDRPASVVKELVENSLDAGARHIRVEVDQGGLTRIQVSDDGFGIREDQVELAFRRHATSKLVDEADLERIATLGFRGEALPSIAVVADVLCQTRTAESRAGVELRIEEGAITTRGLGRQRGTTITVERLFHSLPARLKFMRGSRAEATRCQDAVVPLALAFPEVSFEVVIDGHSTLRTPGTGSLRDAVVAVYDQKAAPHLLDIPETQGPMGLGITVHGVCSTGQFTRGRRDAVHLVANRRPFINRNLTYCVIEAYGSLVETGRAPVAVLCVNFENLAELDANVSPNKQELRFLRERVVYATIQRALRAVLVTEHWSVQDWANGSNRDWAENGTPPLRSHESDSKPEHTGGDTFAFWEALRLPTPTESESLDRLRPVAQANATYVVALGKNGVYLVDQHAAHERVRLEELRASLTTGIERQLLLVPMVVSVPADAVDRVESDPDDLRRWGFDIESFGPTQIIVRAVPQVLAWRYPERLMAEAAAMATRGLDGLMANEDATWAEKLALVLACKTAVKAGQILSLSEMEQLLHRLSEQDICRTCAHGRPTSIMLGWPQIERQFHRR